MKKRIIIMLLSAIFLTTACQQDKMPPEAAHDKMINGQSVVTDFYTVQIDKSWQWEMVDYGDDVPTGELIFYDDKQNFIGGADIVVAINDMLADLPNKIRVLNESVTEEGWIIGKTETIDNAAGGDTASQCHVMIPLKDDWQMHEYIDLYLDGQIFDLAQTQALAETIVIRNQQFFGYIVSLQEDELQFKQGLFVEAGDEKLSQAFHLTEEDLAKGFAIVPLDEEKTLPLAPTVRYYLIDVESNMFEEVDKAVFRTNLINHPEKVYDLTTQDGEVICIEERLL